MTLGGVAIIHLTIAIGVQTLEGSPGGGVIFGPRHGPIPVSIHDAEPDVRLTDLSLPLRGQLGVEPLGVLGDIFSLAQNAIAPLVRPGEGLPAPGHVFGLGDDPIQIDVVGLQELQLAVAGGGRLLGEGRGTGEAEGGQGEKRGCDPGRP